jgi:hypothetical protein
MLKWPKGTMIHFLDRLMIRNFISNWKSTLLPWPLWHLLYFFRNVENFKKSFFQITKYTERKHWIFRTILFHEVNTSKLILIIQRTCVEMAKVLQYISSRGFWLGTSFWNERVPSYLDHFDINYITLRNFVNFQKNLPNHKIYGTKIFNFNEYSSPWNKYFKIN